MAIHRMAQAVLELLDHLGLQQAAVVGHSMGGYVTLALCAEAPDRVAGLGLVCTQAQGDSPEQRAGREELAQRVQAEGPEPVVQALGPRLFGPGVAPESALYRDTLALMRRTSVPGLRYALHAMADRPDRTAELPGIRVPALVLTGTEDRVIPPECSRQMAAALPAAELVELEGAGHMPMLEQPEKTRSALVGWLARVWGA